MYQNVFGGCVKLGFTMPIELDKLIEEIKEQLKNLEEKFKKEIKKIPYAFTKRI